MLKLLVALPLGVLLAGLTVVVRPAAQTADAFHRPMTFVVIGLARAGCEPRCPKWVSAEGDIVPGTLAEFRRTLDSLKGRKLPILIHSRGGDVADALAMGRLIRARQLDVAVSKTIRSDCAAGGQPCPPNTASGVPSALSATCASACVFVLAGGTKRFVAPEAHVGVHRLRSRRTVTRITRVIEVLRRMLAGNPVEVARTLKTEKSAPAVVVGGEPPPWVYAQVRRYLSDMGVSDAVMEALLATSPPAIHWLTFPELISSGLATESLDGAQLVARDEPESAPTRPPAPAVASLPAAGPQPPPSIPGASPAPAETAVQGQAAPDPGK